MTTKSPSQVLTESFGSGDPVKLRLEELKKRAIETPQRFSDSWSKEIALDASYSLRCDPDFSALPSGTLELYLELLEELSAKLSPLLHKPLTIQTLLQAKLICLETAISGSFLDSICKQICELSEQDLDFTEFKAAFLNAAKNQVTELRSFEDGAEEAFSMFGLSELDALQLSAPKLSPELLKYLERGELSVGLAFRVQPSLFLSEACMRDYAA